MQLHLLGQPRLLTLAGSQPLLGYGALVLAWLALHGRAEVLPSRVRLARALWPDEDDDQARRRLTNALYRLKRDFPELEEHLIGDANSIGLKGIRVDTTEFEQKICKPDPSGWASALELYSGDLLHDHDAAWLEEWRTGLRELFLSGLQKTLAHLSGDPAAATRVAQRWVAADPLSEEANTALIRLYAAQNRTAEALAQYQTLKETLERELGATPRRETQAFVHSLRPAADAQSYCSLVGRSKELRLLADQLSALKAGQGGIVVLEGEPGLGKTRLLEETLQLAKWHRIATLFGAANEQHETPYAPLDAALQGAGMLLEVASPLMRETLKPLLEPTLESALGSSSSAVSAALERWLLKLSEPVVLLLDDLQWAGDLFWALLPVLARMARSHKVLLMLSHRSQELQAEPFALEALANLRREGSVLRLVLDGLSLEECGVLARALGKKLEAAELERLYRLSSGNPLVFAELLLGGDGAEHLEGLLRQRFERLDARAKQALEAASVLGNVFETAVWAAMLDFVPPTGRLLEARFLHQDEAKLAFQHDLIRSLIYRGMSPGQRQVWHSKALEILRPQNERAALLAYHALEAGHTQNAIPLLRQAAEKALQLGSSREAQYYLEKVFAIKTFDEANFDEDMARVRLLQLKLADSEMLSSSYLEEVERLEQLALKRKMYNVVFSAFSLKAAAFEARGDAEGFSRAGEEILQFARSVGDLKFEVDATCLVAQRTALTFYQPDKALPLALRALELCDLHNVSPKTHFEALNAVLVCYLRQHQLEKAKTLLETVRGFLSRQPELVLFEYRVVFFEHYLATLEGRHEDALSLRNQELEMHRTLGNEYGISATLQNLISTLRKLGQYRTALLWAEELVERVQNRQQQIEPNMLAVHLAELSYLHAVLDNPSQAALVLQPIKAWLEDGGKGAGAINAWEALGQINLAKNEYHKAYEAYTKAIHLRDNLNSSLGWHLHAAYAAHFANLHAEAQQHLHTVTNAVGEKKVKSETVFYPFLKYLIENRADQLEEARHNILNFASQIKNLEFRQAVIHQVPQHKIVHQHWQQQDLQTLSVLLTSSDGPEIPVVWTLDSGASDKQHFLHSGKVGLRHHRLRRLVLEAAVQGAIPTQSDLADALGVTLRTLESDLAALREQGSELQTLGMKREIAR